LAAVPAPAHSSHPPSPAPPRPRLVVVITVDQLRADNARGWRPQLTGGFLTLLADGAVSPNASPDHGVTETAPRPLDGGCRAGGPRTTGSSAIAEGVQRTRPPPLLGVAGPVPHRAVPRTRYSTGLGRDTNEPGPCRVAQGPPAILPIGRAKAQVYCTSRACSRRPLLHDAVPIWVQLQRPAVPQQAAGTCGRCCGGLALPTSGSAPCGERGRGVAFPHALPADSAGAARHSSACPRWTHSVLAFALAGRVALRLDRRAHDLLAVSSPSACHAFGPDSRQNPRSVCGSMTTAVVLQRLFDRVGATECGRGAHRRHGVTPFPEASASRPYPMRAGLSLDTSCGPPTLSHATGRSGHDQALVGVRHGVLFFQETAASRPRARQRQCAWRRSPRGFGGVRRGARRRPADLARVDTPRIRSPRRWLHQVVGTPGRHGRHAAAVQCLGRSVGSAQHGQPSDLDTNVPLILWAGHPVRPTTSANTVDIAPHARALARSIAFSCSMGASSRKRSNPRGEPAMPALANQQRKVDESRSSRRR